MSNGGRIAVATLIALPTFIVLIALGVWQLQRLEAKQQIIDFRERGFSAAPVELTARDNNPQGLAWRHVFVTGTFDHGNEFHLWSIREGLGAGYEVLTPLTRTGTGVGQIVLIDRGWVPIDRKDPATRREAATEGEVMVRGFARVDLDARWPVTPTNDPQKNIWYSVDYAAMGETRGLYMRPLVVVADATPNPGGLPVGLNAPPPLTNRHLGYALTWFALALALAVIYGLSLWRQLAPPRPSA